MYPILRLFFCIPIALFVPSKVSGSLCRGVAGARRRQSQLLTDRVDEPKAVPAVASSLRPDWLVVVPLHPGQGLKSKPTVCADSVCYRLAG